MEVVAIRAKEPDIERWKAEARNQGISFSEWVRLHLNSVVGVAQEAEPRVVIPKRVGSRPTAHPKKVEGCTAFVPRGTKCKLCGKEHV